MKSIFGWTYQENEILKSPVDYHELRGHLRIGTVKINDEVLSKKMKLNLPITEEEDTALRKVVQSVNDDLSTNIGLSPDQLHYLLWNIFRACCPSNSKSTHCYQCDQKCTLPKRYAGLNEDNKCLFSEICDSAALDNKIKEPAYFGHFY